MSRSDHAPVTQVLMEGTDLSFVCMPMQPVLEAAYAAGIALPYACRRGICGLCAADLVHGTVVPVDALPITNTQCEPGQVLLCRCTPQEGAVSIRPSHWQHQHPVRRLPPL